MSESKKLPIGLIVLLTLLGAVCIMILLHMLHGFDMFNTYRPDLAEEPTMPSAPGFP